MTTKTLKDACVEVVNADGMDKKYPEGMMPKDILTEIHKLYPDGFPLVSVIDIADTMRELYPELAGRR